MQNLNIFDDYDNEKLIKAKQLLIEVYNFNYATPNGRKSINRLETIISKLNALINSK